MEGKINNRKYVLIYLINVFLCCCTFINFTIIAFFKFSTLPKVLLDLVRFRCLY
jgi:hypothetical protein